MGADTCSSLEHSPGTVSDTAGNDLWREGGREGERERERGREREREREREMLEREMLSKGKVREQAAQVSEVKREEREVEVEKKGEY